MADGDSASSSGSRVFTDKKGDAVETLEQERLRLAEQLGVILEETEKIWKSTQERQSILTRLQFEQIVVSDKIAEYYLTSKDRNVSSLPASTTAIELDNKVEAVSQQLAIFEEKTSTAQSAHKERIQSARAHFANLKKSQDQVSGAKSNEELKGLTIPSLDWYNAIQDSDVGQLAQEWDEAKLEKDIEDLLHKLRRLMRGPESSSSSSHSDEEMQSLQSVS